MIAGDRSKISPRDTYLLNDVVMRNNCEWAELYKLGSKVTNRPQLVKIQELILLPTGRAAKVKAKAAIRDMIPDIMAIVQSRIPEHSWNYEEMLALFNTDESYEEEDPMLEENITDAPGKVEDVTNEEQQEVQENEMMGEEDRRDQPDQLLSGYGDEVFDHPSQVERMLDNPSIQVYPQHYTQVNLQTVQNLSTVFKDLYEGQEDGHRDGRVEVPKRLSKRPRPNYAGFM